MNRKTLSLVIFLTLAASPPAFAGLIIDIGGATLNQGTATVAVALQNTGNAPINLNAYGFQFQIVSLGNAPAELSFVDPQPQPFGDPTYLFYQNSLVDPGPLGNVSTTSTPFDTYSGSDATLDGTNVTIAAGSSMTLLTRLTVSYNGDYIQTPGAFQIVLAPGGYAGPPLTPSSETFFQYADSQGAEQYLSYSSTPGLLIVPAIVPEPPTMILLVTGALCASLVFTKHRPRARAKDQQFNHFPDSKTGPVLKTQRLFALTVGECLDIMDQAIKTDSEVEHLK